MVKDLFSDKAVKPDEHHVLYKESDHGQNPHRPLYSFYAEKVQPREYKHKPGS
jgi:hypothetical protein